MIDYGSCKSSFSKHISWGVVLVLLLKRTFPRHLSSMNSLKMHPLEWVDPIISFFSQSHYTHSLCLPFVDMVDFIWIHHITHTCYLLFCIRQSLCLVESFATISQNYEFLFYGMTKTTWNGVLRVMGVQGLTINIMWRITWKQNFKL